MTDLRKRGPDGTLQLRVYWLLREASLTAAEIARRLGADREACRKACHYLGRRGNIVTGHRVAVRLVIYAVRWNAKPPQDRRGTRHGSRNHKGAVAYASWLRMMAQKHGPNWRPPGARDTSTATLLMRHHEAADHQVVHPVVDGLRAGDHDRCRSRGVRQ